MKVIELDGSVSFINAKGCALMRVENIDAVQGFEWASLWPEQARARVRRSVEIAASGSPDRFEAICPTSAGSPKWWDVAVSPVCGPDGTVTRILSVSRDITDRKTTEQALHHTEATLATILEAMPLGVAIADAQGQVVRANAAHRELWQVQPTRGPQKPLPGAGFWPSAGRKLVPDELALDRAVRFGETTNSQLIELQSPTGIERRAMLSSSAPVRDASGRIVGGVLASLDVTTARRAEERVRQSERILRAALESTTDAVVTLSREWRFEYLNHWATDQIAGGQDVRGQRAWDALPGLAASDIGNAWLRCMDQRVPTEVEEVLEPMGRIFVARSFPSEDGGITVFLRDVTESRMTAARLAESEARFHVMAENIPQLAWMAQPDGGIFWFNRRWFDYTGTKLEQVQGWGWRDVHHPDHIARVLAGLERAWETGQAWEDTFPLRRHDGAFRWFLSRAEPVRDQDGDIVLWFGTNTDVTERLDAEQGLRDSEHRLRLATDAGEVGVFEWDLATGTLAFDARLKALWSVGAHTPVTPEMFYAGVHSKDSLAVLGAVAAARDPAGPGEFAAEFRVIGIDSNVERIVSARGRVTFADGPLRMLGTVVDVTTQRHAEAVLARDKAELEALVAERTRDLEESQTKLAHAQRMEALGQLAGGIAHDFNNVLQAVQGGADLIGRKPEDGEAVRRLAHMISEAAERGGAITRRLLGFSRRGELRAETVDPASLLDGITEILGHTLGSSIEVIARLDQGAPTLLADASQLETVLINLATNARDAMPDGGTLVITAGREVAQDQAEALSPGEYVRISVSDTGTGIPPELLARVTEPFFTTKPVGQGTGLGLAMAKGFAEQSGGAFHIESASGKGTTVTLWLPTTAAATSTVPSLDPDGPGRYGARGRILLVDDDQLVREVTSEELETAGFDVIAAESGATALALLDFGEPVDLVVSDLSMPGMDGIAVIREAQRRRPGLPAILLTGFASDLTVDSASTGSFSLLRKPVTLGQLTGRLEVLLEAAANAGAANTR